MDIETINRKVFSELGQEKRLVQYSEILHKMLGIVVDFINSDGETLKLAKMENFNPYCSMMRGTASGSAACLACDRLYAQKAKFNREPLLYQCHAGLQELVLPLIVDSGDYIGCLSSGQFLLKNQASLKDGEIRVIAEEHGLDPELMLRRYRQSMVLDTVQIEGVILYLRAIAQIILETHHQFLFMEHIDAPDKIPLIKQYVKDNYMKRLSLPAAAKKFHMSRDYFGYYFKKELGVGFVHFVNLYRVSRAKEMLQQTRNSIGDIAQLSGFGSLSQFNRCFKAISGMSPREYRRKTGAAPIGARPRPKKVAWQDFGH